MSKATNIQEQRELSFSKGEDGIVKLYRKLRIRQIVRYLQRKGIDVKSLTHISYDKEFDLKDWEKAAYHDNDWNLFIKFTMEPTGRNSTPKSVLKRLIRVESCSKHKKYDYYLIKD